MPHRICHWLAIISACGIVRQGRWNVSESDSPPVGDWHQISTEMPALPPLKHGPPWLTAKAAVTRPAIATSGRPHCGAQHQPVPETNRQSVWWVVVVVSMMSP